MQLRFAALICSATESVFLKRALLLSSPIATFLIWSVLCFAIAAMGPVLLRRGAPQKRMATYLWLALTSGLMQLTTLLKFDKLQVGYSLAVFQLSTLVTVYLGRRYFAQRNIRRLLLGSSSVRLFDMGKMLPELSARTPPRIRVVGQFEILSR